MSLSLRLPGDSRLASLLKQTPRLVFQHERYDTVNAPSYRTLARASFRGAPFAPQLTITDWFQDLFTPLSRYFSAFCHHTSSLSDFVSI